MSELSGGENLLQKIKNMTDAELEQLAGELRRELITDVSETGGHLASNLGAVELTLALHRVFHSPEDKIIWDVGHQCYVHKMLTGRREKMSTLRRLDGLSGFPKRSESEHDMYDSGHASTSVSAALGYAKARDLRGEKYACIAVIGDGALTGGVAFEAMDHAGSEKTPLIVVLNDNQMSIGSSVGGVSRVLNKIRTSSAYNRFKSGIKKNTGEKSFVYRILSGFRNFLKYLFIPDQIFEDLGFKYYGPIDGHDIRELTDAFEFAKKTDRPVLLHVVTKKGKGFIPAEENPTKFHGIGRFNPDTVSAENSAPGSTWSEVFGDELCRLAGEDERITAISAAMVDATGLGFMKNAYPDRVFDVGIAEQHAVSFAAGLALNGCKPVVAIYSTFLQRAYDEICIDVCMQNLPVVFAIDRAGVTGADGETHQGVFDIAFLSSLPNMTVLSPASEEELRADLAYALRLNAPCAIRYGKGNAPKNESFAPASVGLPEFLREGKDALILTDGSFASIGAEAASLCKKSVGVCRFARLKPLDKSAIADLLKQYKAVVTLEDGCIMGGFGTEISRIAAEYVPDCRVKNLGWPDKFIEHGSVAELRKRYGLDARGIAETTEEFLENSFR